MSTQQDLMSPAEVAQAFAVDAKTVARWAKTGKLQAVWTPGGHRRFRRSDVNEFLSGDRGGSIFGGAR